MRRLALAISIIGLLWSCDIRDNEIKPLESWTRIFDTPSLDDFIYPEAFAQSDSGDFVIIYRYRNDESTFPGMGVITADKDGIFKWSEQVDLPDVNPTWPMFLKDGQFHIMGMDEVTLAPTIMRVNTAGQSLERAAEVNGVVFPLALAEVDNGTYLLQSYAPDDLATQLVLLSPDFQPVWEEKYSVLEDAEQRIVNHLTAIQGQFPFFNGATSNRYYFNGFLNFTLSLVFVPKGGGSETGLISGFQDEAGIASAQVVGGGFSLARNSFGDHFIVPQTPVNQDGITSASDLGGIDYPEIKPDTKVRSVQLTQSGNSGVVFASSTRTGQILLTAYDNSGAVLSQRTLGSINPYEIADIIETIDGGIAVLATTFMTGRYPRPAIIKLNQQEVQELLR